MTALDWDINENPTGWFMTEKYDGIRIYWDGNSFYSRQGEKIFAPKSMTEKLPSVPLDGELWYVSIQ